MKGLALIALSIIATSVAGFASDACNYKLFPVFAGGESKETMNCMIEDPTTNYIIVGGKSVSSDFAPAENDHGYVYAIDMSGNWMWGNFFYNVSYAVSDVTGCKMSSASNFITILGTAN